MTSEEMEDKQMDTYVFVNDVHQKVYW